VLFCVAILIIDAAFLLFYFQQTWESILGREFGREFFHPVVNGDRLEFPFVRKAFELFDLPLDYERFRMQLKCVFLAATYVLRNKGIAKGRLSKEERRLAVYFGAVVLRLIIPPAHWRRLGERGVILKVDQRELRWRTHALWCFFFMAGSCNLYPLLGWIGEFPAFFTLFALVCLLFLIALPYRVALD
jgi:hypothetical protein